MQCGKPNTCMIKYYRTELTSLYNKWTYSNENKKEKETECDNTGTDIVKYCKAKLTSLCNIRMDVRAIMKTYLRMKDMRTNKYKLR